ncbi:Enamine deaminase RidA, house cleaning of reactive enamine intermediates, YjgF/YER057c/UK114 family [Paracoccus halophilus]|uniref:Enamine deaminase RidA, house cleaning of reactive enamine intermediates, YjgF/YER057c/UK114 family n=1 Tax=Paracoccus halophilus TaxID=376733 RepID=A0A099F4X5_9RHOB|nr:RidA family protein [Paracoccus halophilus]KGJ05800.1 endoribonuclease [Paracoccus halophilus]SFA41049.1 Enamine deaminase RidA, house cleaning of reactive enamine intermediates, YjgF/YER057c/UK114 family [Paracoccus halophilus]
MTIETRLAELGIELPDAPAPAANYVPYVISGDLLYVSGQISTVKGRLGADLTVEDGAGAARSCGLALLAQARAALGSLDRVRRVVRLGAFVNSTPEFTDQPKVVNGCSDLMVEVFGDKGRHARAAVSAPALPLGVAVEIDGIFEIE